MHDEPANMVEEYSQLYRSINDLYVRRRQLRVIALIAFSALLPAAIQLGQTVLFLLLVIILGVLWYRDMGYRDAIYKRRAYIEVFLEPELKFSFESRDSEIGKHPEQITQNLKKKIESPNWVVSTPIKRILTRLGFNPRTALRDLNILLFVSFVAGVIAPITMLQKVKLGIGEIIWLGLYYLFCAFLAACYWELLKRACGQEKPKPKWVKYWEKCKGKKNKKKLEI